ncbi:MAG: amino acid permease [bacterium]
MKKFDTELRLAREMSLMDVTLIGVGAMIGAGIFVLTGIAAGVAGPALAIAFILNGLVAIITAMSYAELGSCYHDAGGGYLWVKEGLPKWNGFLSGWMSWFAHAVACSLYALGFGAYFEHVFHELGIQLPQWGFLTPQKFLAAGVAVLFAYINFRGASEAGKVGNLVTIAKIVILAIFIGFGFQIIFSRTGWQGNFSPFMPYGWGGVFKAMGLTFIAFQGFEVISQCSEEVRNPRRNIPLAVFLSLIIVIPIYLLVAFVSLGAITPEGMTSWEYLASHKETALVEVSKTFFIGGGIMLLIGGLISTMSALNATIYSSSRVAFAMGRDRNFPTLFSKVHHKNFTPHWSILISLFIVVLMAISLPIEDVASAADIMFLLLFLQVNIAMIRLRRKRPDLDRGFIVPLFPYLSIVGILMLLFLALYMFSYSPMAWLATVVWIVAGLGAYKGYASKREIQYVRKVHALEELEQKQYRILTCISKPESVISLCSVAAAIAKKNNAQIILLHIIEVDERQPLLAGLEEKERARPLFEAAEAYLAQFDLPVRSILQASHRISRTIVETAADEDCNFIVLGRKKHPDFFERMFSTTIDTIVQNSPCEVAVLHGEFEPKKIRRILIPYGEDIHTQLASEVAPAFLEFFACRIQIGIVFPPDIDPALREEKLRLIRQTAEENNLKADIVETTDIDVTRGVLEQSRSADLIIMGGQTGSSLELLFGKTLTQAITEQSTCPVLWLKEYAERETFWASIFKTKAQTTEIKT